jgi:hypothetical protein
LFEIIVVTTVASTSTHKQTDKDTNDQNDEETDGKFKSIQTLTASGLVNVRSLIVEIDKR